jgi:hypothetical protein
VVDTVSKTDTSKNEFKRYTVQLTVVTKIYAPHLSSIEFVKKKEINNIIECYKKQENLSDDDLEILTHLDRGFKRDIFCRPYLPASPVSGALRDVISDAVVRSDPIILPKDKILIETKITPHYRMIAEYLAPVTLQFSVVAKIPKEYENKPIPIKIGGGASKGYGSSIIIFKPEQ